MKEPQQCPKESDVVVTTKEIHRGGYIVPKGEKGTILHVYQGKRAYEIDFPDTNDEPIITMYQDEFEVPPVAPATSI